MIRPLQKASIYDLFLWLIQRRNRFRITGNSMMPVLMPGEDVLVNPRAYRTHLPQPGDIVIARHPYQREVKLIKRVMQSLEDGRCFLAGDNPYESTDSRAFGFVSSRDILGRVDCRYCMPPKREYKSIFLRSPSWNAVEARKFAEFL